MRAPEHWKGLGPLARLLKPAGWIYGMATRARLATVPPKRVRVPVLCVGNLVAGGTGKTPVALDLGRRLLARGAAVHFLTRGYRGRLVGPVRVDRLRHDARAVGDEALLLAEVAPTWVARDRAAGALAATEAGARVVIMDDGFQNPSLVKDLALIVVDGLTGFGNGLLIPAGPLREPVERGLARAQAVAIVGRDRFGAADRIRRIAPGLPLLHAHYKPDPKVEARLASQPVVAFAGIGIPEKFFDTLRDLGCRMVGVHPFPDHYAFDPGEVRQLIDEARAAGAIPVTTAKDAVRLSDEFRAKIEVLTITLEWEEETALETLLRPFPGE